MLKKTIRVHKTARYFILGNLNSSINDCWIVLHGYGQTSASFLKRFKPIEQSGRALVAPEGLHRFYREGMSGKTGASWMTSDDRNDDIQDYLEYLNQLLNLIREQVNPDCRFVLLGFSQGGATAVRWVQSRPDAFKNAVLWAAAFPPDAPLKSLYPGPIWYWFLGDQDVLANAYQSPATFHSPISEPPKVIEIKYNGGHDIPVDALLQLEKLISE